MPEVTSRIFENEIVWAMDVSGSTDIKRREGDSAGNRLIRAALNFATSAVQMGDTSLEPSPGSQAGDSRLLTHGTDLVNGVKHACKLQAEFRSWSFNRLPLRLAVGIVTRYEETTDEYGTHAQGMEIDELFRICSKCPKGEIVVTASAFSAMKAAGYADRFIMIQEELDGIPGTTTWYEMDGSFEIPPGDRQKAHKATITTPSLVKADGLPSFTIGGAKESLRSHILLVAFIVFVLVYLVRDMFFRS